FQGDSVLRARDESLGRLRRSYGDDAETLIADARYGYVGGLAKQVTRSAGVNRLTLTDTIDSLLLNRWVGLPILLALFFGLFQFAFALSPPLMDWIDAGVTRLGEAASGVSPGWLGALLGDGVIAGVGAVLVFVPPIFLLFLALALLEDTGYMARAAFVMDRLMHSIGLHGRSFVPMMLGLGCTVPAVMATRTIENPKDRLVTILVTPFVSCGARLPIYVLFAGAFFATHRGLIIFSIYLVGILTAFLAALILRRSVASGPSGHFVMELPPYRLPTLQGMLIHTWERGGEFLRRAGTIIFVAVVVIWLVDYLGALEPFGRAIAPVFDPAGFGQWQSAVALIFGLLAKEAVVGTYGTLFAGADEAGGLGQVVGGQLGWTALTAYAFMLFTLLYVPCAATLGVIRQEAGSWRWAAFAAALSIGVAWVVATTVFQVGSLFAR
ncbi:MAG: ferrous iron transport protein B, partial [Gemmatimonadetes bacterium]|nr:ferrous iron transport protein B [Gemmatimonadota bacterium]